MVRKGTRGSAGDRKPRIGAGAAVGRWPPQKSAGILARGLSFAELGTRGTRWRLRRWRMFGPRLGPPKGSRRRGGGVPLQAGRGRGPRGTAVGAGALLACCRGAEPGPGWGALRFRSLYPAAARFRQT